MKRIEVAPNAHLDSTKTFKRYIMEIIQLENNGVSCNVEVWKTGGIKLFICMLLYVLLYFTFQTIIDFSENNVYLKIYLENKTANHMPQKLIQKKF